MMTHLSDMDTVSVCSFRPQKPHMQIEMDEPIAGPKSGPVAQVREAVILFRRAGYYNIIRLDSQYWM